MRLPSWSALSVTPARLRHVLCSDDFLADLRDSDVALHELQVGSYAHDNGFRKIVLIGELTGGAKLTLHHWRDNRDALHGNVHTHRWDFVSVVVRGILTSRNWQHNSTGEVFRRYRYWSPGVGLEYRLIPDGTARISAGPLVRRVAGSAYFQSHGVLHQAWGDPGTVTVVAQGPVAQRSTTVLTADELTSGPQSVRALTSGELHESLETLLQALHQLRHV